MAAQSRGLGNSSIAVGAAQGALLDRAASMAQFDANVYKENFQQDKSIASQEKLQDNEMTLQRDLQKNQLDSNVNESLLERQARTAMQDSDQAFNAGENSLERTARSDLADKEGLLQTELQANQIESNENQNALNRTSQKALQTAQITADVAAAKASETFSAAERVLDRALSDKQHNLSLSTQTAIEDARMLATSQLQHEELVSDALSQYATSLNNIDPTVSPAVYEAYVAQATNSLSTRLAFLKEVDPGGVGSTDNTEGQALIDKASETAAAATAAAAEKERLKVEAEAVKAAEKLAEEEAATLEAERKQRSKNKKKREDARKKTADEKKANDYTKVDSAAPAFSSVG